MADLIIDVPTLNTKSSDLKRLASDASSIYDNFANSYLKRLPSSISKLSTIVDSSISKYKKGLNESSKWLADYLSDLEKTENELANFKSTNVTAPKMFNKTFEDIFGKVTMPAIKSNGDKLINYINFGGGIETATEIVVGDSGGQFVADKSKGVYGYVVSSIDGKKHVVFRQSEIKGWSTNCNRAAAASIASAFTNNPWNAVKAANRGGIGYNNRVTNNYFNKFGLTANVRRINGSYDSIKNDLVNALSKGSYVMFDLSQPNVRGKSGQKWTSTRHWLSILDIKKTGNGPNDYAVFVSDSGHKGSTVNHGLGTGWYSINEFSGQKIANFTTISKMSQST